MDYIEMPHVTDDEKPGMYQIIIHHENGVDYEFRHDEESATEFIVGWSNTYWDMDVPANINKPSRAEELVDTYMAHTRDDFTVLWIQDAEVLACQNRRVTK